MGVVLIVGGLVCWLVGWWFPGFLRLGGWVCHAFVACVDGECVCLVFC